MSRAALPALPALLCMALGCAPVPAEEPCGTSAATQGLLHGSALETELGVAEGQMASVVGLSLQLSDGQPSAPCSAVLLDARWALSARHCAGGQDVIGGLVQVGFDSHAPDARARVLRALPHPSLDVMLLELAGVEAFDAGTAHGLGATPIPLALEPPRVGQRAVLAGLGTNEDGTPGERRFVAETVTAVDATRVTVDGVGESGACFGDSGGPLLGRGAAGDVRVLGTLSRGSSDCLGEDHYVRADVIRGWACEQGLDCRRPACGRRGLAQAPQ